MRNLLNNNADEMISAIRENKDCVKASICDAFSTAVFRCGRDKDAWQVLTTLQEYAHLINTLAKTDTDL